MGKDSNLVIKLRADVSKLNADLKKAKNQFKRFKGSVNKIGAGIRNAMLTAFGGAAVLQGLRAAVGSLANFELAMDKVNAVTGASSSELEKLTKNALFLGRTTKYTAGEIANLQLQLAKIGFDPTQIVNATDAVRKLALVSDEDLGEAAKSMAGTLNSFNLNARESGRVANVMAESFAATALTLEKFTVGTANSGAIANALGVTLESNTARLGTLVNANIDASKAGTDLRKIYIELNKAGIDYETALDMVAKSSNKVGVATELVGIRAAGALAILSVQRDKVDTLNGSLGDNVEELGNMTSIMEDNLLTDWAKFNSALDGVIQKGTPASKAIRSILQAMTGKIVSVSTSELEAYVDALKKEYEVLKPTQGALDTYNVLLKKGSEELKKAKIALDEHKRLQLLNTASGKDAVKIFEELQAKVSFYKEKIVESTEAIKDSEIATIKQTAALKLKNAETKRAISLAEAQLKAEYRYTKPFVPTEGELGDDIEFDTDTTEDDAALEEAERVGEEWKKVYAQIQADADRFTMMIRNVASEGIISAFDSLGDAIGGGGTTLADAFGKIINVMASNMKRIGAAMIAQGIAQELFKKSLLSLTGAPAIAAGAGLVAAGAALSAAQGGYASEMSGGGGGGGTGSFNGARGGQSINVNVQGELVADGRSLVAVFNQQSRADSRQLA